MMALQAQQKNTEGGDYEKTIFDPGVYPMTLTRMFVVRTGPTKFAPEGADRVGMIWTYTADGEEFELADWVGLPKNLAYNEKGAIWKRLGQLLGTPITNDNVTNFYWAFEPDVDTFAQLVANLKMKDDKGKNEKTEIPSLRFGTQEVIGMTANLVVSHYLGDDNLPRGNNVDAITPIQTNTGPRRPAGGRTAPKAAPAAAEPTAEDLPY